MKQFLQELMPPKSFGGKFDTDNPVEIFHEVTKWHRATFNGQLRDIMRYLVHPAYITRGAHGYNEFPSYPIIKLPEPKPIDASFATVLANRRSSYNLQGAIELEQLSALLHHSIKVNRQLASSVAPKVQISFRPYPSPGGLYPTEFYLILDNVIGVKPCVVHYDARNHFLRIIRAYEGNLLQRITIHNGDSQSIPPVTIVLTTVPQRVTVKYGGRGYRMGLLEVGHASQNICLVAQAIGLGTLVYGSYFDDELAKELDIDSVTEVVASMILVGRNAE